MYTFHVPKALEAVPTNNRKFLLSLLEDTKSKLLSVFVKFELLYSGTDHQFSAQKFHEHCDNRGSTISICLSEHDHVFGFYCSVPWKSSGGLIDIEGDKFLFKIMDQNKAVKFTQTHPRLWHNSDVLIGNGQNFWVKDRAHQFANCCGQIKKDVHVIPESLNFDENTYLTGSQVCRLKEIEVYRVIGEKRI